MKASISQDLVIYMSDDGEFTLPFDRERETIWASQAQIMELFAIDQSGVSRHIRNVFADNEVDAESSMQKVHIAGSDRPVTFYGLDVVHGRGSFLRVDGVERWLHQVSCRFEDLNEYSAFPPQPPQGNTSPRIRPKRVTQVDNN